MPRRPKFAERVGRWRLDSLTGGHYLDRMGDDSRLWLLLDLLWLRRGHFSHPRCNTNGDRATLWHLESAEHPGVAVFAKVIGHSVDQEVVIHRQTEAADLRLMRPALLVIGKYPWKDVDLDAYKRNGGRRAAIELQD